MRTRLAVSALAVTFALGACTGSGTEPGASSPAPAVPTTETSGPTEPTASSEPTEPTETSEPAPEPTGSADAACLDGTWLYTAEEVEKTFARIMGSAPASPLKDLSVEGDATVTFDGSTIVQEYGPQVMSLGADPGAIDMKMVVTMSGRTVAQYTVDGDVLHVTEIDVDEYKVSTEMLVDGKKIDGLDDLGMEDLVGETGSGLPEGQARYSCAGDTLTLETILPDKPDFSVTWTLTRP